MFLHGVEAFTGSEDEEVDRIYRAGSLCGIRDGETSAALDKLRDLLTTVNHP